jgi:hypothetical protein
MMYCYWRNYLIRENKSRGTAVIIVRIIGVSFLFMQHNLHTFSLPLITGSYEVAWQESSCKQRYLSANMYD